MCRGARPLLRDGTGAPLHAQSSFVPFFETNSLWGICMPVQVPLPVFFWHSGLAEFRPVPVVCFVQPCGHGDDFLAPVQAAHADSNCRRVHVPQDRQAPHHKARNTRTRNAQLGEKFRETCHQGP